jgi:phosphatidylglycerophosphate synthase
MISNRRGTRGSQRFDDGHRDRLAPTRLGPAIAATTLARLALIPAIIATLGRAPAVTAIAVCAFVVADVHDGVLARRHDADGPARRSLDSIVDRVAIDACLIAAACIGTLPPVLLVAFLLRDGYCAAQCTRMVRRRRVAIKADWVYRSYNVSIAAWGVSIPYLGHDVAVLLAAALLAGSAVVAWDLTRLVAVVLAAPPGVRGIVVSATALRRDASIVLSATPYPAR